ncbi:Restriction of telomere capping protein 5 [Arthroderma sp. PD_2]|nr:Restriction of telomere capping protein 5 [Arthroderma sp. PD_2]
MGAGQSTDSRKHGASPEEMSQILARRFASKCFTPLELAHLKDNFNSLALKQGDVQYWNEEVLSKFLGIPDGDSGLGNGALDAGPVIFRMVSYLGAFPFQNTLAPSVLTFDAMVKVIVLLTERYGKVLRRGRKDRIKLLFGSLADVGRKEDPAVLSDPSSDDKPENPSNESGIQSHDAGFSIDKPSNDDDGENDDDDLVLAALESLDAIEVFKHDQRIDRTVYEAHISIDTFQRLLMLLVVLSPLQTDEETSKYFSQLNEESLESARGRVKNILASFDIGDDKNGIDYATFSWVVSTSLPYLFDPLTPLFEHLLFSKNLDLSRRKDSGTSSLNGEQKVAPVPSSTPLHVSITLPGSFDSCILDSAMISHLSFFLPTSSPAPNLLQNGTRLHGVFSSGVHGESLTSFSHNVLTWDAPSILLLTGVKKDTSGNETESITVGAYLPHPWKASSSTSSSHHSHFSDQSQLPYLFQLSPEHVVMQGSPSIGSLKSNLPVVSFSTKSGIAIGCKIPPPTRKSLSGDSIRPTPAGGGSLLIDSALENAEFVISNGLSHGEGVFLPPGIASWSPSRSSSSPAAASETINISIYNTEVWGIVHTAPASAPSTSKHSRSSTANGEIPDAIARQQANWSFEAREAERRREIHLNVGGGDSEEQTGRALLEMAGIIGDSSRRR